jgi:hypothetical protein
MAETLKPRQPIRRFDVFAEYNKLKALREGRPLDEAKGYGIWLAKVVAARRFGASGERKGAPPERGHAETAGPPEERQRFRSLGDELQTDALFDREIVARMGDEFYRAVFAPAIAQHFEQGDRYESIRDSLCRVLPMLAPGGRVVVDDYGWAVTPGVEQACHDVLADEPGFHLSILDGYKADVVPAEDCVNGEGKHSCGALIVAPH